MNSRIVCVGRHEGLLRDVSRGCAYGDPTALEQGAAILAAFIKCDSIIIPMPSHIGYATTMKQLCENILERNCTLKMMDCLKCIPHQSNHIQKLHNDYPCDVFTWVEGNVPANAKVYIIDNCVGTGTTAQSALHTIPNATVLAITKG